MDLFKKEPAVLLGILVGVLSAVATAITQATGPTGDVDWITVLALVLPIISGLITRQAVYSPDTHEKELAAARPTGPPEFP